jgi:hypothetical protein
MLSCVIAAGGRVRTQEQDEKHGGCVWRRALLISSDAQRSTLNDTASAARALSPTDAYLPWPTVPARAAGASGRRARDAR